MRSARKSARIAVRFVLSAMRIMASLLAWNAGDVLITMIAMFVIYAIGVGIVQERIYAQNVECAWSAL